jgi:hypothetical protein
VLRTAAVIRIGFRSHLAAVDSFCGAAPPMNGDSLPRKERSCSAGSTAALVPEGTIRAISSIISERLVRPW